MNESDRFDPPMNESQRAVANSLTEDTLHKIDCALLANVAKVPRKVARVVGSTMSNPEIRVSGLPDLFYAERVRLLVESGKLESKGNLYAMRYCEVWLPESRADET